MKVKVTVIYSVQDNEVVGVRSASVSKVKKEYIDEIRDEVNTLSEAKTLIDDMYIFESFSVE